jgi:hypothetical protein
MWWRRKRIARARAVKLGAAGQHARLRRVRPSLALAIRFAPWRAQLAWCGVVLAGAVALYFVWKIGRPAVEHEAHDVALAPSVHVRTHADVLALSREFELQSFGFGQESHVRERYGREALGALAFPAAALVVALLLSWQRRTRRLLRHGREAMATIRRADHAGEYPRVIEVQLVYGRDDDHGAWLLTLRPPESIGDQELVLYDPNRDLAVALADLPGAPRLVDDTLVPTRLPVGSFVLPALGVLALAAVAALTIIRLA